MTCFPSEIGSHLVGFIPANLWQNSSSLTPSYNITPENAELIAEIQTLRQTVQTLAKRARLREMAIADLQSGYKEIADELTIVRNDVSSNRADVSKATKEQKVLARKLGAMQRCMKRLRRLLGLRRSPRF